MAALMTAGPAFVGRRRSDPATRSGDGLLPGGLTDNVRRGALVRRNEVCLRPLKCPASGVSTGDPQPVLVLRVTPTNFSMHQATLAPGDPVSLARAMDSSARWRM